MRFYYQIKGRRKETELGWSYWDFPPLFSGQIEAKDKKEAKRLIELEYDTTFPLRVLRKDIDNHECLLKIEEMDNNSYLQSLFKLVACEICNTQFRVIDLYNNSNCKYKGKKYCSSECETRATELNRVNEFISGGDWSTNIPVIYKITDKRNDKCYIGQTKQSFTLRWWQHIKWGTSDCKFHKAMQESEVTDWAFEVIEVVSDTSLLNERESFYIEKYNSIEKGYNTANVNAPLIECGTQEKVSAFDIPEEREDA